MKWKWAIVHPPLPEIFELTKENQLQVINVIFSSFRRWDIDSVQFLIHLYNFPPKCFDPLLVPRLLACGWLWIQGSFSVSHFAFVS